ncbi:hypothetical protein P7C70_g4634, partial [Phenoliferia sp. Uapishka_3]
MATTLTSRGLTRSESVAALTRKAQSTYHPKGYGVSAGLARARAPFRTKNTITAGVIGTFIFSVYYYSISAVKQDDFSDVAMPSEAERKQTLSIEDEKRLKEEMKREVLEGLQFAQKAEEMKSLESATPKQSASLLSQLKGKFGGGAVVDAPAVDKIGTVGSGAGEVPARKVV